MKRIMVSFVVAMIIGVLLVFISKVAPPKMMADNGRAAAYRLRMVHNAEMAFWAAHQKYATTFGELTEDDYPPLLSGEWMLPQNGYIFTLARSGADKLLVLADPVRWGHTGIKHYCVDQTGVIRVNTISPANINSPPLLAE